MTHNITAKEDELKEKSELATLNRIHELNFFKNEIKVSIRK